MQSNEAKAFEDDSLDGVFFAGTSADLETVADLPFSCEARDFMSNLEKIIEEENHNSGIRQPDIAEPRKPMPRSQPKKKRNAFHCVACMMMGRSLSPRPDEYEVDRRRTFSQKRRFVISNARRELSASGFIDITTGFDQIL